MRPCQLLLLASALAGSAFAAQCPMNYHVMCGPNEMDCYRGVDPSTNCDLGYMCVPQSQGFHCPNDCPCMDNEQTCYPPPMPHDGPQPCEQKQCYPQYQPSGNPIIQANEDPHYGSCQFHCPAYCAEQGMSTCPTDYDSQGCPVPETCFQVDQEAECLPQTHDSMGCPLRINETPCEDLQMVTCNEIEDDKGCSHQQCAPEESACQESEFLGGCQVFETVECSVDENYCFAAMNNYGCPVSADYCSPHLSADCPGLCDQCGPDEQYCYGPYDEAAGCHAAGSCEPLMVDDHCFYTCPAECASGEQRCYGPYYDPQGCSVGDICVPEGEACPEPEYDSTGCQVFADLVPGIDYDPERERICDYDYDSSTGCMMPPYAVPVGNPLNGECPGFCQTELNCHDDPNAIICHQYDPVTGCELEPTCDYPVYGYDGQRCPDACQENCPQGTYDCGQQTDANGCPTPNYCSPIDPHNPMVYCPRECADHEMFCDQYENDGCFVESTCIDTHVFDKYGQLCPVYCPTHCAAHQIACPTTYDYNGCEEPGYCVNDISECPSNMYDSNGCYIYDEVVECGIDEHLCYGDHDELGCYHGDYCQHISSPCHAACDIHTEMACPGKYDPNPGFGPNDNRAHAEYCIPAYYFSEKGRYCHGECEPDCGEGSHARIEYDYNGCKFYNCQPNDYPCQDPAGQLDSRGCPIMDVDYAVPTVCAEGEDLCSGHYDHDGCMIPDFCYPEECPESEYDYNGCFLDIYPECDPYMEYAVPMGMDGYTSCDRGHECRMRPPGNCDYVYPTVCNDITEQVCGNIEYDEEGCEVNMEYCYTNVLPCPDNTYAYGK